ncbi:prominin-like protein isoform X1 [Drosophila subobscura]|uniref:prominin-like protein isoform X1 n=2 Tax=Drosophila subobscura TaxID=7241 RepID=UPI00155B1021|nr:prominin-like protein isoform X1 [Drosophila subobscura]
MESKDSVTKNMANCSRKRKQPNMETTLAIGRLCAAILLIVLVTRVDGSTPSPSPPDDPPPPYWRKGYSGDGTTHEQMGALHFAEVEYSKYEPSTNYSQRENITKMWVDVVFKVSRTFFDKVFPLDPTIPRGYITDLAKDNMRLGPKVIRDDWADWLNAFWLMWIWILFLVALIVLSPFAGVMYFCFCCHRCKLGCPACHSGENKRKTLLWSTCLILFLPLIAGSMGLAFLSNGMLERGLANSKRTLEMGSVDTCNFLKDVSDHVHHLFVNNFEELETHLVSTIKDAPKHMFKDMNDVAEGNAVAELTRILANLPNTHTQGIGWITKLMGSISKTYNKLRIALRGLKRDVNHAAVVLCGNYDCLKFLQTSDIEFTDTSRCLHMDELPNTHWMYWDIEYLGQQTNRRLKWLPRLRNISKKIMDEMERVSPPIIRDIRKARILFAKESRRIQEIIDVVISDIHLGTIRASRAFEDLYDKFNETRYFVVLYIAAAVIGILCLLVTALIVGCLARRPTGASNEYFTTRIASYLLILSIILIFCALSVMLIVVLFNFVIGGVAYKGACAPLREEQGSALLKQLDSAIDLRTIFSLRNVGIPAANVSAPPIRVSNVIKACEGDDYLFKFLHDNRIFDIDDFLRLKLITKAERSFDKNLDLSKDFILTEDDKRWLSIMDPLDSGTYHGSQFTGQICNGLQSLNLDSLGKGLSDLSKSLEWRYYDAAVVAFENAHVTLKAIKTAYYPTLHKEFRDMHRATRWVDQRILYQNYNFRDSFKVLREKIGEMENFVRTKGTAYISTLGLNLSSVIEEHMNGYLSMIVREAHIKIGRCKPLTYIYERGLDLVCKRMVDPINGYWIGVLVSAILLIPVACIAHRLQCVFKQHRVIPIRAVRARAVRTVQVDVDEDPCPFCSARPKRTPGGHVVRIDQDGAETPISCALSSSQETVNINDAYSKNKLD